MPELRTLILDGVKAESRVCGIQIPRLAMLSWRGAHGPSLPFALEAVKSAAVLDISGSNELERLPAALQVRKFFHHMADAKPACPYALLR